eukprot:scaffold19208_cov73-Phaeocystis_antarctica.AAC.2
MQNTLMMTLDYVGDEEAVTYPTRSAWPPDLASWLAAQPGVACVRPSIVPFLYKARGGDAIPEVALWAIDRFVAVRSTSSLLAVEPPSQTI